jgi:hypothetical protein
MTNNERIKEIAKQAHKDVIKNTPSFLVTKELYEQKFAELIVAECLAIVERDFYHEADPLWETAELIKEHFGVEK